MTYLLIPGGGGDPWDWHLVADRLRAHGHEVLSPRLPYDDARADLAAFERVLREAIGDRERVTVAAHSMGAFHAPLVADRADALLLVAPMVPLPGVSAADWPGPTDDEAPDAPFDLRETFLHDVSDELAAEAMTQWADGGESEASFAEPWPLPAWPEVPTRALIGARDRLFPESFQRRRIAQDLGVEPEVVDSGHMPMLSRPDDVTAWLLRPA
ncbi:MAG: alpha/beta hydrolase [Solirubrobacteraceae bacterium]|nr:alpha/beta hydrolase [Solirubrobacteraceae bacterium]